MSSFSGLSTALSSLHAQRHALEVSGQNIANANTPGYTRQRAELASVGPASAPALHSAAPTTGNGTRVAGVARLGDVFLDARLRSETAGASLAATRSQVLARLESTVAEPGDKGVAHALDEFWSAWQELGNAPGSAAARAVVLEDAQALAARIAAGHGAVTTQWAQARSELDATVVDVNSLATTVADLNARIRGLTSSGGSVNELVDQRNALVTELAALVGANAVERADGTVDVMVSGNPLVRGDRATGVGLDGASSTMGSTVTLRWAGHGTEVNPGGHVAALVGALAPASAGGVLAGAARSYDELASRLVTTVNTVHTSALTDGDPQTTGGPFFVPTPEGLSAARTLTVAVTDIDRIAVARPGAGPLDGSMADAMAAVAGSPEGPDAAWAAFVVDLGVRSRSAAQHASVTESTRANAQGLQLAAASVDIDEESVGMLAYQRAYEGAARVLTAIDEMLDTLINRTGVVGR
jgi:flagellar hook-associated protein 1 FlgK